MHFVILRAVVPGLTFITLAGSVPVAQRVTLPNVVLWAWERPENLAFIDPRKVAVAFLSRSIDLSGDRVTVAPRLQPLRVPDGTTLVAVVRLSTRRFTPPTYSVLQTRTIIANIIQAGQMPGCRAIQIDFDARRSERGFYRALLENLRRQLPDSVSLSITALASWCLSDNWIAGLLVDDAVPMLFRLGSDRARVLHHLAQGGDFSLPVCRQSIGVSLDEPFPVMTRKRRVYVFSPKPWTQDSFQSFLKRVSQ